MSAPEVTTQTETFQQMVARAADLAEADERMLFELIRLRKEAGITQKDVADFLGIKQATISKFERHDNDPHLSTIRKYALAVGAHVEHTVVRACDRPDPVVVWNMHPAVARPMEFTVRVAAPTFAMTATDSYKRAYDLAS